jgi:hypothetical protein
MDLKFLREIGPVDSLSNTEIGLHVLPVVLIVLGLTGTICDH